MTVGHLLFAAVTAAYILVGIMLEEHDLIDLFGDEYRRYKERVSMLIPWRWSALPNVGPNASVSEAEITWIKGNFRY
jgi:methanethiol S-methyltransferase